MRPPIPLRLQLLVAVALFAAAGPVVKWLISRGGSLGLTAPGAISFCNVLFVSNVCGGLMALFIAGPRRVGRDLKATGRATRWLLAANVGLAVLIPALIFTALETTSVTNAILLSRLEPGAFALFAMMLLGTAVSPRQWLGYGVILAGGLVLALIEGMARLNRGDLLVMGAALCQGYSAVLSKQLLERIPLKCLVVLRTLIAAVVFFVLAIVLYGFHHFADAFGPGLWLVMTVYALIIVTGAQLLWFRVLEQARPAAIAGALMLSPLLGLLAAFLLLGEIPNATQIVAGVIIMAGMLLARTREPPAPPEHSLAAR